MRLVGGLAAWLGCWLGGWVAGWGTASHSTLQPSTNMAARGGRPACSNRSTAAVPVSRECRGSPVQQQHHNRPHWLAQGHACDGLAPPAAAGTQRQLSSFLTACYVLCCAVLCTDTGPASS